MHYMDSSHDGHVSRRSCVAAIEPFSAVIVALCRLNQQHILSISDISLSLSNFGSEISSKPKCPDAHIRIFYDHFSKSAEGGPYIFDPQQWAAVLDLMQAKCVLQYLCQKTWNTLQKYCTVRK